jgi:ketosteroid isomerase-like protein
MRTIARWVGLIALSSLLGCTVYKERPATDFAGATGGESLERVLWKNVKAKDWLAIERALGSNFVSIGPDGRFGSAAWLDQMKQLELKDYSIGDLQVEMSGDTFVVSYTITLSGTRSGQPLSAAPTHQMSVWQRHKSGWILIAHTVAASG